ncbi:S9 family peptidase [Amycolatopsis eburnea]|uniref:S9 family peptidase n=1 Tax=Amycolatopsis eburnea TaxID=2267691 RepID=A0A3R9DVV0_9PSEU|nr:DPP IV N-terminal domain-containing protein [Amycolatopsis eburnea]RSD13164.1 S9 family peptidase [Amycolatopsis eburnea]
MERTIAVEDYRRAEQMLRPRRSSLITGVVGPLTWSARSDSFWYPTSGAHGAEHVLVDPAAGTRQPAFDHARMATALAAATGEPVERVIPRLSVLDVESAAVVVESGGRRWRVSLADYACTPVEAPVSAAPGESRSPDGRWTVFVRDHNLWVRDETGAESALTHDGSADNAYATETTFWQHRSIMRKAGAVAPPVVLWAPDGAKLVTHRIDEREVGLLHLVESAPEGGGRPVSHAYRYAMAGEENQPMLHLVVVDLERRTVTPSDAEPFYASFRSPLAWDRAWLSADGGTLFYLDPGRFYLRLRLIAVDLATGRSRVVVEETGQTRVEPNQMIFQPPLVRTLANGEVLWYSQRDGWGHLYRYSASGVLVNQVTKGAWAVREIVHVDEDDGVVFFTAAGLVDADPYVRQLCRAELDGSGFTRLTGDLDDHVVQAAPSGRYLVDTASLADRPPVAVVRDRTGKVVVELERADVSALERAGWTPPERFRVKAADGTTDIYGLLWRPYGFDPQRRYPVVDRIYPGPHSQHAPPGFDNTGTGDFEAYAALGFAVVSVDGRGTPGRDKEFHDLSYGHIDDFGGLDDHVAAITELGSRYPWLDTGRVGITGNSAGGSASVRAVLAYPEFYRVAIGVSGCHDPRLQLPWWGEVYQGPYEPERYLRCVNAELAGNLRGKLLLIHGELDDNALPYQTLGLVDALIEANKDFDLLMVPGAGHTMFHREAYVTRRKWDYFVRHLMDATPPAGYELAEIPSGSLAWGRSLSPKV